MADEPLENTVNKEYEKAPEKAKAAAKAPSTNYFDILAQQFKQTKKVVKKAVKFTLQAALLGGAMYLGYSLIGLDAVAAGLGFIGGDWLAKWKNKEKITMKDTVVRGIGGTLMGAFLHYVFPIAHYLGDSAGAAVKAATGSSIYGTVTQVGTKSAFFLGPVFPAFIYLDNLTHSMMDWSYKRPKGEEFWKSNKKAVKILGIPVVLNANLTKQYLGTAFEVPIGGIISAAYSLISAKPKEKKNEVGQKQVAPAANYAPQPA